MSAQAVSGRNKKRGPYKTHCLHGHRTTTRSKNGTCNECARERAMNQNAIRRDWLEVYKVSRGCSVCGYDRCSGALHLHHTDPSNKKTSVGEGIIRLSMAAIRAEAEKCVILCANCHYEHHWGGEL